MVGVLVSIVSATQSRANPPVEKGYTKVFDDEFDGAALDESKWNFNYPWGTLHNGRANMQPSQVTVADGVLTLKAEAKRTITEPAGKWNSQWKRYLAFDYTSGAINTKDKHSFKYGYFEGRFKVPKPDSSWPAFWMLQSGWPPELDVLEVVGERKRYYYTYHYGADYRQEKSFGSQYLYSFPLDADWHTYGVEWTPEQINFYFDDKQLRSFTNPEAIEQMGSMYLIINLQVGGWAPEPNAVDYPALYQCDWVRVWQKDAPTKKVSD